MVNVQKALQVWVQMPASFIRRLGLLSKSNNPWNKAFLKHLKRAKSLGVDAVILPVSWRVIEPYGPHSAELQSNWASYRRVIEICISQGLKVIPEFHSAATGLKDASLLNLLPDWLWGLLVNELSDDAADSIKYIDSYGQDSFAATSLWSDHLVLPYFERLLSGFQQHFSDLSDHIPHINLGGGPEGELRYPFLGFHSEGPDFLQLPCFSAAAKADFKQFIELQTKSEPALKNQDLYLQLMNDDFFEQQLSYLQDLHQGAESEAFNYFLSWYHQGLMDHGQRLLALADKVFNQQWQKTTLGLRFALHLPDLKNSAEIAELVSGLCPQLGADQQMQKNNWLQSFSRLLNGTWKSRTRLLICGLDESTQQNHWALISAAQDLNLQLITGNSQQVKLEQHAEWDKLLERVMKQDAFSGWILRDLDILSDDDGIGCSRLRQFGQLKYAQGQYQGAVRKSFRVMAPLHLKVASQKQLLEEENWQVFEQELNILREAGVTAVSTDLWWGLIEGRHPGEFDWSYYDRLVEVLDSNNMHWVPILSFHQAGGNVNDDFNQTIPLWLWGKLLEQHRDIESVRDLQYVSETGDASMEYVSLWADPYVLPYYLAFVQAFRDHYRCQAHLIDEINISMGPAGELRYPSYNAHDWGDYPNRGTLQCYSPLAQRDWCIYLRNKFNTIEALNYTFGTQHQSFDEITMPSADSLFENKKYIYSAWGRELLTWYNAKLVQHGHDVLGGVLKLFTDSDYINVPIGIKIPGIHWEISDPKMPRAAEISAGLIRVHPNLNHKNAGEYVQLLKGIIPEEYLSRVVVHFTCLEMINKDHEGYSRAEDLVNWMADAANEVGVELMGENALAGELYGEQGWQQMERALTRNPGYGGITLLRMQNFFDENKLPLTKLRSLVNRSI
ncbi:family 14 glycosylhydrolase [Psychromonas ossibalaenae]|uniref:family 14 glycosylhydrolase n=1 Tax=Psychromonas ossibalaenae TaxID=444922 RepID=UPI00035C2047|nr:family 14 glycosylhydrolase [Psychromonas ossibalaenae]